MHTHTHTHTQLVVNGYHCKKWTWQPKFKEMDMATKVQILDKAVCISHSTNMLWKGMNTVIFSPAIGK